VTAATGAALVLNGFHVSPKLRPVPGNAATGTPWCATFITRLQISTGRPPPVSLRVGEESSLPSHTPVTRCAV